MKRATVKLGDFLTLKRGYDLPEHARVPGVVPVVSSSGITGTHKEAKVEGPGVVTGRYGTLGEVYYLENAFWPLNTALYVQDFKGNNGRFAAYLLKWILQGTEGSKAAVPGVNRNDLHARAVLVPETVQEQEAIAATLATYDDLIETNRRRIQLLERAARLLYKEWFVHLRFPGHETTPITDGVPQGWERKVLGDICSEVREIIVPSALSPDMPYIGLEHIPRRSITLCDWGQAEQVTSSKHRFREGEIIFGKIRPYFHKVGIALTDGVASADAIIIRPAFPQFQALVLMTSSSDEFVAVTTQQMKEGSKMPRADWKQMRQYPVLLPPNGLLHLFNKHIEPVLSQLRTLAFSNRQLARARDLLLPRLMSGEVAV